MTDRPTCPWCRASFEPRHGGGRPQKFCVPLHRRQFEAAGRAYLSSLIGAGLLSVQDLSGAPATRALATAALSPSADSTPIQVHWAKPHDFEEELHDPQSKGQP